MNDNTEQVTMATDAEYRKDYNRGWRTSAGPSHQGALERADMRGESNAWYEGYEDFACGWPKRSTPNAKNQVTMATQCEWFALCDHAAIGTTSHVVLGDVPICDRCATKLELPVSPFTNTEGTK